MHTHEHIHTHIHTYIYTNFNSSLLLRNKTDMMTREALRPIKQDKKTCTTNCTRSSFHSKHEGNYLVMGHKVVRAIRERERNRERLSSLRFDANICRL